MCIKTPKTPKPPAPTPPPVASSLQLGADPFDEDLLRIRKGNNRGGLRRKSPTNPNRGVNPPAPRPGNAISRPAPLKGGVRLRSRINKP